MRPTSKGQPFPLFTFCCATAVLSSSSFCTALIHLSGKSSLRPYQYQAASNNGYRSRVSQSSTLQMSNDPYDAQYQRYVQALEREKIAEKADIAGTISKGRNDSYAAQYQRYAQTLEREKVEESKEQKSVSVSYTRSFPMPNEMDEGNLPGSVIKASQLQSKPEEGAMELMQQQEQEDTEEKFLKMVSSEIEVKKLNGQNPYAVTDIDFHSISEKFIDTFEHTLQKKIRGRKEPKEDRKTIVVLGTGWAAHSFVKMASTHDLRIVVVSPVNHFVFTPMLASAAVGTVEYRSMTEPIRITNPYIDNFVEGGAIGVDVCNKIIKVQLTTLGTVTGAFKGLASNAQSRLDPEPTIYENSTPITYHERDVIMPFSVGAGKVIELQYDHLICAVGTSSRSYIVPGAKDYCFNLKTAQDSKRLRTAIGEALEFASRPDSKESYYTNEVDKQWAREERKRRVNFILVGGGPTGVELAGELKDFVKQICRQPDGAYHHLAQDISITLVHGGQELLPAMKPELRQRALKALLSQGVEVILNSRLQEVGKDYVKIKEKGTNDEITIPCSLTVWAAGNAPVPFVKNLLSQLPESAQGSAGRINVDKWLRCPTPTEDTFGSILVLGDVACIKEGSKYDEELKELPQTAQVAGQQGAFTARMLNRGYDLNVVPPRLPDNDTSDDSLSILRAWLVARGLQECPEFRFLSLGLLAYVGGEEALNQVELGDVPLFNYSGKIAFVLWKTVYLGKQASSRNQALIAFDWMRTEFFGRDITRL